MIKIGIIGCGGIARQKHIPELKRIPEVQITALCDNEIDRARNCSNDFNLKEAAIFDNPYDMLEACNTEAIHICTPNNEHEALTIAALDAGNHVMVEKPLCISAQGVFKVMEKARRAGKTVSVGYQRRFRKEATILKSLCQQGALGTVYFARGFAMRRRGVPTWGSFTDINKQGGGCLIDIAGHVLDLLLWLMDDYKPEYIACNTYEEIGKRGSKANYWGPWNSRTFSVEDSAFAFVRMKSGATITIDSSFALNISPPVENSILLCGSKAGAVLGKKLEINGEYENSLYTTEFDTTGRRCIADAEPQEDNPNYLQLVDWIHALENEREPLVKLEQAATVQLMLSAMYASARKHTAVAYEQFIKDEGGDKDDE